MYEYLLDIHNKEDILTLENFKFKENDEFIIAYTDYSETHTIKNFIFDKIIGKIVTISNKRVIHNDFDKVKKWIDEKDLVLNTYESFEGTNVLMYYTRNKWYFSTTSYLDASECTWKSKTDILHLMKQTISDNEGEDDWNTFINKHDKEYIYNYTVVHHDNIHLINYSDRFSNNEYKKLFLNSIRKQQTLLYTSKEYYSSFLEKVNHPNIIVPQFVEKTAILSEVSRINQEQYYIDHCKNIKSQGLIVINEKTEEIINLQSRLYNIYFICNQHNKYPCTFTHYLHLYKKNVLDIYLKQFSSEKHYNNVNIKELIHNTLIEISKESLQIFRFLYQENMFDPVEQHASHYHNLPYIYKHLFYQIKGYYKLKYSNVPLNVNKIYKVIKKMPVSKIVLLLKERKNIELPIISAYNQSKVSNYITNINHMNATLIH